MAILKLEIHQYIEGSIDDLSRFLREFKALESFSIHCIPKDYKSDWLSLDTNWTSMLHIHSQSLKTLELPDDLIFNGHSMKRPKYKSCINLADFTSLHHLKISLNYLLRRDPSIVAKSFPPKLRKLELPLYLADLWGTQQLRHWAREFLHLDAIRMSSLRDISIQMELAEVLQRRYEDVGPLMYSEDWNPWQTREDAEEFVEEADPWEDLDSSFETSRYREEKCDWRETTYRVWLNDNQVSLEWVVPHSDQKAWSDFKAWVARILDEEAYLGYVS
jgi:hypothetical protein